MAVVYSSELSDANSSSMISSLENHISSFVKLSNQIYDFIGSSESELVGGGYDAVRTKLSMYADAFKKQAQICNTLVGNIKAANNTMLNYMEGYTKLDDSEIETIDGELTNAKNMLAWLKDYSYIWVKDPETQEKTQIERRNGSQGQIDSYEIIIEELDKLLRKLKELSSKDAEAYAMISGSESDVNAYHNCINGMSISTFSF